MAMRTNAEILSIHGSNSSGCIATVPHSNVDGNRGGEDAAPALVSVSSSCFAGPVNRSCKSNDDTTQRTTEAAAANAASAVKTIAGLESDTEKKFRTTCRDSPFCYRYQTYTELLLSLEEELLSHHFYRCIADSFLWWTQVNQSIRDGLLHETHHLTPNQMVLLNELLLLEKINRARNNDGTCVDWTFVMLIERAADKLLLVLYVAAYSPGFIRTLLRESPAVIQQHEEDDNQCSADFLRRWNSSPNGLTDRVARGVDASDHVLQHRVLQSLLIRKSSMEQTHERTKLSVPFAPTASTYSGEEQMSASTSAFSSSERVMLRKSADGVFDIEVQHQPFKISFRVNGQTIQIINEKQLLNIEKFHPVFAPRRRLHNPLRSLSKTTSAQADSQEYQYTATDLEASLRLHYGVGLEEVLGAVKKTTASNTTHIHRSMEKSNPGAETNEKYSLKLLKEVVLPFLTTSMRDAADLISGCHNNMNRHTAVTGAHKGDYSGFEKRLMRCSDCFEPDNFGGFEDAPTFGPTAVGIDVSFEGAEEVYGLFEHAAPYALRNFEEPYRLFNLDNFGYQWNSPHALYASIPSVMALHSFHKSDVIRENWGQSAKTRAASPELSSSVENVVSGFALLNAADMWVRVNYEESDVHSDVVKLDPLAKKAREMNSRTNRHTTGSNDSDSTLRTWWVCETGCIDCLIFCGPSAADVHHQLHTAVGFPTLPPLCALGRHQSRWNYEDEADVRKTDALFDTHAVAYDNLWLDIEYADKKCYLTFDPLRFPDFASLLCEFKDKKRSMTLVVDPHLSTNATYKLYTDCLSTDGLVKRADTSIFYGRCWPGQSVWPDFTLSRVRKWWENCFLQRNFPAIGDNLCIWNDMNEPSVFDGPELTLPKSSLHQDGSVEHREVHNLYGLLHHQSTFNGLRRSLCSGCICKTCRNLEDDHAGDKASTSDIRSNRCIARRPFVLTRSSFLGVARTAAIWTGDNVSSWNHLKASIAMILSAASCGCSFIGADVGGFFGQPDGELILRWHQLGAFYPFYREHSQNLSPRKEPWNYPKYLRELREATRLRYRLLPFWYTLFAEYALFGRPIIRPVWWLAPQNTMARKEDEAFLIGSELYVQPITAPISSNGRGVDVVQLRLPKTTQATIWYDIHKGAYYGAMNDEVRHVYPVSLAWIPVLAIGGSIIPMKNRYRRTTREMAEDPITLHVFVSLSETAEGNVYGDDGCTYGYLLGDFYYRRLRFARLPTAKRMLATALPQKYICCDVSGQACCSASSAIATAELCMGCRRVWLLWTEPLPIRNEEGETIVCSDNGARYIQLGQIVVWGLATIPHRVCLQQFDQHEHSARRDLDFDYFVLHDADTFSIPAASVEKIKDGTVGFDENLQSKHIVGRANWRHTVRYKIDIRIPPAVLKDSSWVIELEA